MKKLLLDPLNTLINRYLSLDVDSKLRLQKLNGRAITLQLLPFHHTFQVVFKEDGIEMFDNELMETETKITGTPSQLFGVMINKNQRKRYFADDIKIEGDAVFAHDVIALFDSLHIDWEERASHLIGDVPAYHVGRLVRGIGQSLRKMDHALTKNIDEYLHEEADWFPPREALQDFFKEIDTLRMDVDRMESKIKHLATKTLENES